MNRHVMKHSRKHVVLKGVRYSSSLGRMEPRRKRNDGKMRKGGEVNSRSGTFKFKKLSF